MVKCGTVTSIAEAQSSQIVHYHREGPPSWIARNVPARNGAPVRCIYIDDNDDDDDDDQIYVWKIGIVTVIGVFQLVSVFVTYIHRPYVRSARYQRNTL